MTEGMALLSVLLLVPIVLLVTDRLGWTTFYTKKKRGTFLGSAMLGVDQLFAPQEKQRAIEYRQKQELRQQQAEEE